MDVSALEHDLAHLEASEASPALACPGEVEVTLEGARAAAVTRLGSAKQTAAMHAVFADDLLTLAVCEGNYKDPRTVVAGGIVAASLLRGAFGPALRLAHERIWEVSRRAPRLSERFERLTFGKSLRGIGTSFAALRVHERFVEVASVGECCVYRLRAERLERVTRPDVIGNSDEYEKVLGGMLDDFKDCPTRVLGMMERCDIEIHREPRTSGDAYFLSTAGFEVASAAWKAARLDGQSPLDQCRTALAAESRHQRIGASAAVVELRTMG